jgi:hypothetical protein
MNVLKTVGFGVVFGLVGAAIWAGIAYATNREIGFVAWAVGGLVGFGVRVGAGQWEGGAPGAIAAGVAILAIVAGKYAAVSLIVGKELNDLTFTIKETDMIAGIAGDLCKEREAQGKRLAWPAGMTAEKAAKQEDYPRDVWAEATKQWNSLPPAEKSGKMADRQKRLDEIKGMLAGGLKNRAFWDSFSPFDLLWFGLAMLTAFRLGSGTSSPD